MEEKYNFYPDKIKALGALDEMDKNCYHIQLDQDVGLNRRYTLGVHVVRPDFSDLESIKDRIKAIIMTHGHDYQFKSLTYLTIFGKSSIYATKTTG